MDENILAWNATNWITVTLMAAIGFFILGIALKWLQSRKSQSPQTASIDGASLAASY